MRRLRGIVVLLAAVAGCYHAPAGTARPYAPVREFPPGVAVVEHGVFADSSTYCCWLGAEAAFSARVPAKATHLIFVVNTPDDIPIFRSRPQTIALTVGGAATKTFADLPLGRQRLDVPIAPQRIARTVPVRMRMSVTFVPDEQLHNGDTRVLSVYLKRIRAR